MMVILLRIVRGPSFVALFVWIFFFFSSRRRHTRCREVSWARRCVQETVSTQSTWGGALICKLNIKKSIQVMILLSDIFVEYGGGVCFRELGLPRGYELNQFQANIKFNLSLIHI
eukprot:TRINITY_DN16893_c0_g1_i1.p4 TRINITY_DN16893_c0_g1~~TRINITY_DN16893_c0_g1_i1.p4  ORF type:complete len:115 (-),score=35.95 TRINITY_DN16893_c0_g1_i1:174-518(-)